MAQSQPPADARDARARAKADKAYLKAQRPWYKKKRFIIPLLLILLIIIIVATTTGGNNTDDTTTPGDSSTDTQEPEDTESFPGQQDGDVVGQAGATLVLGDMTLTSTPLVAGDATLGQTVCTTVSLNNGGDETVSYNTLEWQLQSPGGAIANSTFTGSNTLLNSGELVPGGAVTGDVCFENESGETGQFIVLYDPAMSLTPGRAAWINTL